MGLGLCFAATELAWLRWPASVNINFNWLSQLNCFTCVKTRSQSSREKAEQSLDASGECPGQKDVLPSAGFGNSAN